jgi:hypothetical protein
MSDFEQIKQSIDRTSQKKICIDIIPHLSNLIVTFIKKEKAKYQLIEA